MARAVLERTLQVTRATATCSLRWPRCTATEAARPNALRYARELARAHPFDPAGPALIAELER